MHSFVGIFFFFDSKIFMSPKLISSALQALTLDYLNLFIFRMQEGITEFCSSKHKLISLKLYLPRTTSLSNQSFL